jgi:hypothetical protein
VTTSTSTDPSSKEALGNFATWRAESGIKSPKIDISFFEEDVRGTVALAGKITCLRWVYASL